MRQPFRVIVSLAAALFFSGGYAQAVPITKITIEGLQRVNPRLVQLSLTIAQGQEYNRAAVLADFRAVMGLGLFDPVKSTVDADKGDAGVNVVFRLVENPVVTEIRITGAMLFPEDKLLAAIRNIVKIGDVFNTITTEQVYQRLLEMYQEKGYEMALKPIKLSPEGKLEYGIAEAHIAAVTVRLDKSHCIKTEALVAWLDLKEGQLFSLDEINRKTQAAQDLGLFESFTASILPAETPGGRKLIFNCSCLRRPRPSPDGLKLLDVERLLADLDAPRERFFAFRYDLAPPPSQALVNRLTQQAQGNDAAAAAAGYDLALALAQLHQRRKAAEVGQPLITQYRAQLAANQGDTEARARLARLLVIGGQVDEAIAVSKPAIQGGRASPDLLATAVHAYALKLGLAAAPDVKQKPLDLPEVGWVLAVLSRLPRNSAFFRSELTAEYAAAVKAATAHFAKLQGDQLLAELAPFLRFMAIADFLETLDTPLRPVLCAPNELKGRLGQPVFVTFGDRQLEAALRARATADSNDLPAAYALGTFLVCREVAIRTHSGDGGTWAGLTKDDRDRDVRKAIRQFDAILAKQKSPDEFPGAMTYLAVARAIAGSVPEAQDILLAALDLPDEPGPEDVYVGTCMASLFFGDIDQPTEQQMIKQGREKLAQHIAAGKGGPLAREVAMTLDGIAGDWAKAAEGAKALTDADPKSARAWTALGFYRLKLKDTDGAQAALQQALGLDPEDPYAQYALGLAEILADKQEEGRKRLETVEIETLLDQVSSVVGL